MIAEGVSMKFYLEKILWAVGMIFFLYTMFDSSVIKYFCYFVGLIISISGLYRIVVSLTKECIEEKYLHKYYRKSGLLQVVAGGLFLLMGGLSHNEQNFLYYGIGSLILLLFIGALSIYLDRKYRKLDKKNSEGTATKNKYKYRIISFLLIYVIYLIAIALFPNITREVVLLSNNISRSDIIFEYKVDTDSRYKMIFVLYLKNDENIGILRMSPRNANVLFFLPRVYGYVFDAKYSIDIETGNATVTNNLGIERSHDKNIQRENIRLISTYWYTIPYPLLNYGTENRRFAYMGVKHEFNEMENIDYKFIEYFSEIFDGVYIYFFVSYEQLDSDMSLGTIR